MSRRTKWTLFAVLLLLIVAAYGPATDLLWAWGVMLDLRALARGDAPDSLDVLSSTVRGDWNGTALEALLYLPAHEVPDRSLVLVAGVSELGCYHPRLVALSRLLARKGFAVLTPDIAMFRRFEIAPEAMDQIAYWFSEAPKLINGGSPRLRGLGGISFSGTLALITASRPELQSDVSFVLAIGPYEDLMRTSESWFAAGERTVPEGHYPTRFYAKWIIMLAALDRLTSEREREFLAEVLRALLLQKGIPAPLEDLSPQADRWYRLALLPEDESDPELSAEIQSHLAPRLYEPLNPARAAPEVRCPVFLVHGAYDDLIPPGESEALQRIIAGPTHLLVTPFLTHTHPQQDALPWSRQVSAGMDMLWFFYRFAGVAGR